MNGEDIQDPLHTRYGRMGVVSLNSAVVSLEGFCTSRRALIWGRPCLNRVPFPNCYCYIEDFGAEQAFWTDPVNSAELRPRGAHELITLKAIGKALDSDKRSSAGTKSLE